MTVFITSDTHFGHENVIEFDNRPFKTITEHDDSLMKLWNQTVGPGDTVYHLGDFSLVDSVRQVQLLRERLNGKIHLILGNHDKRPDKLAKIFDSVQPYLSFRHNRRRIVMCHYPIEAWHGMEKGSIHFHGHCHGSLSHKNRTMKMRLDMNTALWDFKPVHLEIAIMTNIDQGP